MSNHSGSRILNNVLKELLTGNFFTELSHEKKELFCKKIIDIGCCEDCESGEIFEDIGHELHFCYLCMKHKEVPKKKFTTCTSCTEFFGIRQ